MAGVGKLLKQAQKMQKKIEALEAQLAETTIDVSSGGGALNITITVSGDIRAIKLDPEFLKEDQTFLEETLATGVQDAIEAARKAKEEAMGEVTAGMNMPGLF
ncbi:MAG: YbaB/EbfC family nucleoid-associated protein [Verrucomicrobiae bacterium]|nr:YbaB/EbfC family nucleoid-associated protein [Verrucomicrobiae bacterium]